MRWLTAARERLRTLIFGAREDADTEEEMRFHLEMEAQRREREEGLAPAEARRRAAVAFGGVEKHREAVRDARGWAWLSGLSLDVKLGARMIAKTPVLTLAGGLAIAVAVCLASAVFQFMNYMASPKLPLEDVGRIVRVQNWNLEQAEPEMRALRDYGVWRGELESITDLSAVVTQEYQVSTEDARYATLDGAETAASLFRVLRVAPLLGRTLLEADEAPDAQLVAVLGYTAWQRLFDGDRAAIGRTVRLGAERATVVGVMPPRFGFPVDEEVWVPLRHDVRAFATGEGPPINVIGRLAPGASLEQARAELETIGLRVAGERPATHEHLRPRLEQLEDVFAMTPFVRVLNLPFLLFLLVVAANVGTLVFARTATREGEIAVRTALGASRRRIVLQLFTEALVLTGAGAAVGLAAAHWGLHWGMDLFWEVQQSQAPWWFDAGISWTAILYAVALVFVAAAVIGGLPALKATGKRLRASLPQAGAGGSGARFGAISTGVIIVQVALCVAFLPVAFQSGLELMPERNLEGAFPAGEFLAGRLGQAGPAAGDPADSALIERTAAMHEEVKRRLAAESGITAVSFVTRMPGFNHPMDEVILDADTTELHGIRRVGIDLAFFDMMDARVVSGRAFHAGDLSSGAAIAIVDQGWVQEELGGRNVIGQRIRYETGGPSESGRWYEIVGVVDVPQDAFGPGEAVAVFHPLRVGRNATLQVYMHTTEGPETLVPRIQAIVSAVDPAIAMIDLRPLDDHWRPVMKSNVFFAAGLGTVAAIILLFALIGIYSLVSFTVTQRSREIGIRAALGANPRRIITSIFGRAAMQIGLGVLVGAAIVSLTIIDSPEGLRLVVGVAIAMAVMGMIGCIVPALRALRIQPTDALRSE